MWLHLGPTNGFISPNRVAPPAELNLSSVLSFFVFTHLINYLAWLTPFLRPHILFLSNYIHISYNFTYWLQCLYFISFRRFLCTCPPVRLSTCPPDCPLPVFVFSRISLLTCRCDCAVLHYTLRQQQQMRIIFVTRRRGEQVGKCFLLLSPLRFLFPPAV
jgi:hypothetical protein